ncbi:hypothetical protein HDV57DRAFT_236115 [Trichoderma longibrachiatum]
MSWFSHAGRGHHNRWIAFVTPRLATTGLLNIDAKERLFRSSRLCVSPPFQGRDVCQPLSPRSIHLLVRYPRYNARFALNGCQADRASLIFSALACKSNGPQRRRSPHIPVPWLGCNELEESRFDWLRSCLIGTVLASHRGDGHIASANGDVPGRRRLDASGALDASSRWIEKHSSLALLGIMAALRDRIQRHLDSYLQHVTEPTIATFCPSLTFGT